jgi:hypothetical protein
VKCGQTYKPLEAGPWIFLTVEWGYVKPGPHPIFAGLRSSSQVYLQDAWVLDRVCAHLRHIWVSPIERPTHGWMCGHSAWRRQQLIGNHGSVHEVRCVLALPQFCEFSTCQEGVCCRINKKNKNYTYTLYMCHVWNIDCILYDSNVYVMFDM